jgi:hypothetical protein
MLGMSIDRSSPHPERLRGLAALALIACAGCAPLPPQSGIAVSTGPTSDQWTVRLDPELGTPATMTNRILQDSGSPHTETAVSDSVAEAAVRAVFREHADWFRLRPGIDDIRMVRGYPSRWLRLVRLEQTYMGISVGGAGYDARVLPSGRVGSLEGRFYPDIHVDVRAVLSADQAEDRARPLFPPGVSAPAGIPQVQFEYDNRFREPRVLVIVPRNGKFVLAWGVVLGSSPWTRSRVYVDATNGTVLGSQFLGTTAETNERPR